MLFITLRSLSLCDFPFMYLTSLLFLYLSLFYKLSIFLYSMCSCLHRFSLLPFKLVCVICIFYKFLLHYLSPFSRLSILLTFISICPFLHLLFSNVIHKIHSRSHSSRYLSLIILLCVLFLIPYLSFLLPACILYNILLH